MNVFQNNGQISQNQSISVIFNHAQEQIQQQHFEIQQMQIERQKTYEKLKKHLEKLNLLVQRMTNQQIVQQVDSKSNICNQQYKYEIQMDQDLELPCYRNRIFQIRLRLVENQKVICNANNILVELQVQNSTQYQMDLRQSTKKAKSQQQKLINIQGMLINHYQKRLWVFEQNTDQGSFFSFSERSISTHSKVSLRIFLSSFNLSISIQQFIQILLKLVINFYLAIIPIEDGAVVGNESKLHIKKEWVKPLVINDVSIKAKKFSDRHCPYFAKSDGTINLIEQN